MLTGLWAIALGGLGVITSVFVSLLKIVPETTLKAGDEVEVAGRLMLGILFSFVIGLTVVPVTVGQLFDNAQDHSSLQQSLSLLVPFLAGYSLPLVLGALDKIITVIQLTIGIEDRRFESIPSKSPPSKFRRKS
jgi:hypothetical protein